MFKKRSMVVSLEKNPPTDDDILRESLSTEQKIDAAKDVLSFAAAMYVFCKVVDTAGKVVVEVAKARA